MRENHPPASIYIPEQSDKNKGKRAQTAQESKPAHDMRSPRHVPAKKKMRAMTSLYHLAHSSKATTPPTSKTKGQQPTTDT